MERYLTANLVYWRSFLGLSHQELAKVMGISSSTLYLRMKNPGKLTARELLRLAEAAGVSLGEIMDPNIHEGRNCAERETPGPECRTCAEELPLGGCGRRHTEGIDAEERAAEEEETGEVAADDEF